MLSGVTGSIRLCQQKGRKRGMRERTTAAKVPMLGQNTTSCFSSNTAFIRIRMFSSERDLHSKGNMKYCHLASVVSYRAHLGSS